MANRRLSVDRIDTDIIQLLREDSDLSQNEIASLLCLSQSTVGARIRRLRRQDALIIRAGVNARRLGLDLAKVDCACQNASQVIELFKECPCFLNAVSTSGRYNVSFLFAAEDSMTLAALVDRHLRNNPNVREVEFGLVTAATDGFFVRPRLALKRSQTAPCGADCNTCPHYGLDECSGCPSTHSYMGNVWKPARRRRQITVTNRDPVT